MAAWNRGASTFNGRRDLKLVIKDKQETRENKESEETGHAKAAVCQGLGGRSGRSVSSPKILQINISNQVSFTSGLIFMPLSLVP